MYTPIPCTQNEEHGAHKIGGASVICAPQILGADLGRTAQLESHYEYIIY
jgi:hypothetical protein